MKQAPTLLIVPYSPATPIFLSETFLYILDKLCGLNFDGVIFPFYIDGYVKRYAGVYIAHGKIHAIFGEDFASNVLRLDLHGTWLDVLLFPYIFLSKTQGNIVSLCLDDEEESVKCDKNILFIPRITSEKGTKDIENGLFFSKFDRKCKKHVKICIQTLEKLIEYT